MSPGRALVRREDAELRGVAVWMVAGRGVANVAEGVRVHGVGRRYGVGV